MPWAAARGYWGWVPEDTVGRGEALFVPMPMFPPPCAHYNQPEPIDVTGTGQPAAREPGGGGGIHRKPRNLAYVSYYAGGFRVLSYGRHGLREVGGELPRFFDPDDPVDAARAVAEALSSPNGLPEARDWAMRFTWDAAALETWAVYDRALAG